MKHRWAAALAALAALLATRAPAQVITDTLTAAAAVSVALEANPMLKAARSAATAAAERVGPAGALPDPRLQFGLMNRMASEFGSTTDPMTMNQVQLIQMLPWPGKLGNPRAAARRSAAAAAAAAEEQANMLAASVRMVYYDVAVADRAVDVMERTRGLIRDFLNVTTTMYAVGAAGQQDVLRAQVEVARMSEEISRMSQMRIAAATRLNALMGREAETPLGPVQLPEATGDSLAPVDTLIAWALEGRPALRAGAERVSASEASLTAVRREIFPDFEVGFAFQGRPEFQDMLSVMVGINLPLFAGARQLPLRREIAAKRDMAAAELANLRNETTARIIELRARAVQDANLGRLYRSSILPQARAAVHSGLSGYRVGRVGFMQLLDDQMVANRYEIETYRLLADYHQARGELAALVGREL
jgi:outer membrane protein TolC